MARTIFKKNVKVIGDYLTGPTTVITTEDGKQFEITSRYEVTGSETVIKPYTPKTMTLEEAAKIIAGCFKKESNFFELLEQNVREVKSRRIVFEYDGVNLVVTSQNAQAKQIIQNWEKKKELTERGIYYLIAVRKLAPIGKYDGKCLVLADSEEAAVEKVKEGYNYCECTCLGEYNVKKNTLLLKNAHQYLDEKFLKFEN